MAVSARRWPQYPDDVDATTQTDQARSRGAAGLASLAGMAAVALGVGAGELLAGLMAPRAAPLPVVGAVLIDLAPTWAKDAMIALFGTADKIALLIGIGALLLVLAALAGRWEYRRRGLGSLVALALGALVGVLALTRENADGWTWLPAVTAGLVAAVALRLLVPRAASAALAPHDAGAFDTGGTSRRGVLTLIGMTAVAGALATAGGFALRAGAQAVSTIREAIRLPAPAVPAAAIAADADLGVPGLSPLVTPTPDFYRIDTALVVPTVTPEDWELRIHGLVEQEVRLTWDELLALPLTESVVTLSCVSNPVGGDLVGNAVWLGYPIRELLARARPLADADMVLSRSADGFTAGTPLGALTDERDALLAVGMNGEPLPPEHGFPVRMVVPGLYGYVSATKWVVDLEVTRFDRARAYWTDRGWSAEGPIKLQSRIDVPRARTVLAAGPTVIAGVAWMPHTGVSGVQVQVDDGPWQEATLGVDISADTWVQWRLDWDAEPGEHRIRCRARDADGDVQTEEVTPVAPNGATGWHEIEVSVS